MNRVYTRRLICYNGFSSYKQIGLTKGDVTMSDKELVTITIGHYGDLQQIKQANGGQENPVLDYVLKLTVAKLSSLGVNVEDITLN